MHSKCILQPQHKAINTTIRSVMHMPLKMVTQCLPAILEFTFYSCLHIPGSPSFR